MNRISEYRIDQTDVAVKGIVFYFKIEDSSGGVLFSLGAAPDGLYYYPADSSLLSPDEEPGSETSYKCVMDADDIKYLFEALIEAGLDKLDWKVSVENEKVIIEKGQWDSRK